MIKRFAQLDIATSDLADAASTYDKNFGFKVTPASETGEATITLAGAQLRLQSGPAVADLISSSGEGLAAIWLEAEDVDQIAGALHSAGLATSAIRSEAGRRLLQVDPKSANLVPLFIFDRK
jgi:predicted enzyme related to lactoylglutathione lyase